MKEIELIERALEVANGKGCYNLDTSYKIKHAVEVLKVKLKSLNKEETITHKQGSAPKLPSKTTKS